MLINIIDISARRAVQVLKVRIVFRLINWMETNTQYLLQLTMQTYNVLSFHLIWSRFVERSYNHWKSDKKSRMTCTKLRGLFDMNQQFAHMDCKVLTFFFFYISMRHERFFFGTSLLCPVNDSVRKIIWRYLNSHRQQNLNAFNFLPRKLQLCVANHYKIFFFRSEIVATF